jgi:hypothetical protein
MPRPKLTQRTKQCRLELRVLALWRLGNSQPVERAALRDWLAASVDVEWGRQGRPRDLKDAREEADEAIDHLLGQGNCKATGDSGHETIRLVKTIPTLEQKVKRLRAMEGKARKEAGKAGRAGGQVDGPSGLPRAWAEKAIKKVGERLTRAVEKAVVEGWNQGRTPKDRTRKHSTAGGDAGQEPARSATTTPPGSATAGDGDAGTGDSGPSGRGRAGDQLPSECAEVVMLPVIALRPNGWNPNLMSEQEEAQVQEEVRRAGRPAHDILVRPLNKRLYQVIDGEHNWLAAKKAGLAEVPCRIIEVSESEALRLTYMRNLHGTRDPLLTGRLFRRMMDLAGVSTESAKTSQRQFARDNNIDEATLRNYLLYARAAEVRNAYAPETADGTVRGLSVAKLRLYLDLPEGRRDEWLDRGASADEANKILAAAGKKPRVAKGRAQAEPSSGNGHEGQADGADASDGEHADMPPTSADGGDAEQSGEDPGAGEEEPPRCDEPARPSAATGESEAGGPLSPAEREAVDGVQRTFRDGRPLVRQKILAGLAAYPDAVTFFRRMIKTGG